MGGPAFFFVTMKNVLITGGTGSLGSALVATWYEKYNITVLSRDPHKQHRLSVNFPDIKFILADICDKEAVEWACHGQDILIHAAALKQVNFGQLFPAEFHRVNVLGTNNISEAWEKTHQKAEPGRQAVFISTDKAVQPINTYGKTKAVAEDIALNANFSVLRYGNVVDSAGSFLQVWRNQRAQGQPIKVRQPSPTRFALTLTDAVQLVDDVLEVADPEGPAIYIPHSLSAFSVADVAAAYAMDFDLEPLLPGEKQHEILLAAGEYADTVGDRIARVSLGYNPDGLTRTRFSSEMSRQLSGREVLDWLSL